MCEMCEMQSRENTHGILCECLRGVSGSTTMCTRHTSKRVPLLLHTNTRMYCVVTCVDEVCVLEYGLAGCQCDHQRSKVQDEQAEQQGSHQVAHNTVGHEYEACRGRSVCVCRSV